MRDSRIHPTKSTMDPNNKSLEMVESGLAPQVNGFQPVKVSDKSSNVLQFNISFTVKSKKHERVILNNVADVVTSGTSLAIMGPSGAGEISFVSVFIDY